MYVHIYIVSFIAAAGPEKCAFRRTMYSLHTLYTWKTDSRISATKINDPNFMRSILCCF